jgi:hypothetical protein
MKSSEHKSTPAASRLQAKNRSTFFAKKKGENAGPSKESSHSSPVQSKAQATPFFGNTASNLQAKLQVQPAGDAYEKEADTMADRVTQQMPISSPAPPNSGGEENNNNGIQPTPLANGISRLQRQRAFESPNILEKNSANMPAHDEMPLQRKTTLVQAKEEGGATDAPDGIESQLNSSKGQGSPLPEDTRSKMESGFGHDFSNVNIHTGQNAAQMNEQIGARAFTHGNDIYFNNGEYKPNTAAGDHLLAHELTHTVQQGSGVQKKEKTIQRAAPKKPNIRDASQTDLDNKLKLRKDKKYPGKIYNDGSIEIRLTDVEAKYYLVKADVKFLELEKEPIKIKKPRQERNSKQMEKWKSSLKKKVKENLANAKPMKLEDKKIYSVRLKKEPNKPAIYGDVDRIAEEITVPYFNSKGKGNLFDVEHKVDYQIAGPLSDQIENLILLDREKNRELGKEVESIIDTHLKAVIVHYAQYFSGISEDPKATKNRFNVTIEKFKFKKTKLPDEQFWENTDIASADLLSSVILDDDKIPKGYFLLFSSDERVGYQLPFNATDKEIGGFKVTVESKNNEVKTVLLEPLLHDPNKTFDPAKVKKVKEPTPFDKKDGKDRVYIVKTSKSKVGASLKGLIGGGPKGFSPIEIGDPELDGFNVKVAGKVISTLSILKDVDISFGYENGMFFIRAEIPLTKLTKNIPKPFSVTSCSITLEANSVNGVSLSGNARFKIDKFGEGEVSASVAPGKGVSFDGSFNFDSKWFNPAMIKFTYAGGKWAIEGEIGIQDGVIKGVKSASLNIKYAEGELSANGLAKLDVPGIDSVKLSASYSEGGGFKFVATADLKKMPGIKSGSVTVSILSKGDGPIQLGVGGTAEPDFPGVPGLTSQLTVMYEDGVFDMKAKVGYKKGRFDGTIEVGVTNKAVDEKGQPVGEPQKGDKVLVFGFGSLTVDLFKGSKGTISVRLTPDKQVLVAGSFTVKDLTPFGDGVNIHKKIIEFPSIKIPLVGIPGVSIFFEIGGGAYFKFNWQPLVLKELTISFKETNISEIETAQVDIHGAIGSKAVAEAYMEIKASLGAQVLIASIKGSLAGQAGIAVEGEAGGSLDATWNNEKGLQLKEINAFVSVNPKAIFRLTGSVSVDLDLWITTINLYYKEWVLAEGSASIPGLALKVNFPLKFDEQGNLIKPGFDQLAIEQPNFSGEQGKAALDDGINADAKKERKLAKDKLRQDIANDMRNSVNDEDFSPTEYAKKLQKKYNDDEEMKAFIMDSVEEEVKIREYEEFEQLKQELRKSELPLSQKMSRAMVFKMFRGRINSSDYDAFITELQVAEQEKQAAKQNQPVPV